MPCGCLNIKYGLLDLIQQVEVLVKDCFNLNQTTQHFRTSLTGKVWHLGLVTFLAPSKVHLALAYLHDHTETPAIMITRIHGDTKI